MTGVRIEIDDAAVRGALGKLAALGDDMKRPLREVGDYLVTETMLRFEGERGPSGLPWKQSQRAATYGGKTLNDRGRLKASITREVSDTALLIGTNVRYAAIHQFGGEIQQHAYSRKVAFRSVRSRAEDGTILTRRIFAKTRGSRAHKRVELQAVTYGERIVKMPARPFLGVNAQDEEVIVRILRDHLQRITGGAAA